MSFDVSLVLAGFVIFVFSLLACTVLPVSRNMRPDLVLGMSCHENNVVSRGSSLDSNVPNKKDSASPMRSELGQWRDVTQA